MWSPGLFGRLVHRPVDRPGRRRDARIVVGSLRDALSVPRAVRHDLGLRLDPADPARALDALARLEILVDLEEVLDLQPVELRQVVDIAQVLQAGIVGGYAQDLVVAALLVRHPEHTDRPAPDQATGKGRLRYQYQRVERIPVLAEGALDEPVVRRILGGGEQGAVEADPAGVVVDFVLVALSFGDLHGDVEVHLPTPCSSLLAALDRRD